MIARAAALEAFGSHEFDVVVVGGGVTGAGVALDAASRGYSVALVERGDYATGTSSRSSKLIHGGLRYLQNFDLGLVREALLERALLVKLAPHLVRPLPLLVPTFEGEKKDRLIGVGLNMYDVMASERFRRGRRGRDKEEAQEDWSPDRHRTIDGGEAVAMMPALEPRSPAEAYLFYDCQTDDVRLVLTILGEAERFGAVLANRCDVTSLLRAERPRHRGQGARRGRGERVRHPCVHSGERDGGVGGSPAARGAPGGGGHPAHLAEPRHARHNLARPAGPGLGRGDRPPRAAGETSSRSRGWAGR